MTTYLILVTNALMSKIYVNTPLKYILLEFTLTEVICF